MNTKYMLLSLAALLVACSESEDVLQNPEKAQLTISTEIVSTRAYFDTGLKNDVEFKEGNAIGFYLFDMDGDDYSRYTNEATAWNRKAIYKTSGWVLEETMTLRDVQAKVVAYYPYKENSASNQNTRAIPPRLRVLRKIANIDIASYPHYDGQQDYLWGESTDSVDRYHPNARIQFKHVLPRITFEVQKSSDNSTDDIYLRSATLKNSADNDNTISVKGILYENGRVEKISATGQSITNGYTAPVLLNKNEARSFDFLVLPTEVAEGSVILRIEVRKGSTGQFHYHDISIPATKWESGKQYTYPVTLNVSDAEAETPVKNQTFTVNGVSFTMVGIEAGTFQMGASADGVNETPVHTVTLTKNFYMGETEVTQALWYAVMGQKPTSHGEVWSSRYGLGDNYPAYYISYEDCEKFLAKLNQMTGKNFRFPTEAEWEFAAKGGNKSKGYIYAGSNTIGDVAWWYDSYSGHKTQVVKGKTANELGLYDMTGNVWEWCYDWYDSYSSTAQTDPTGPTSGSYRVRRGGGWGNGFRNCRVSIRFSNSPDFRSNSLGLRLAL